MLITSTSDGANKTEMSEEAVKKAVAAFHSETLEASFRRATVHAYTIWAICMDVFESDGTPRFNKFDLERNHAYVTRCAGLGGMTARMFRAILMQTEDLRVSFINDSQDTGSPKEMTVGCAYALATARLEVCIDNHVVNQASAGAPQTPTSFRSTPAKVRSPLFKPDGGNSPGKRPRGTGDRKAWPRLPGGMGSAGGKQCAKDGHDPTKGGNVRAWCTLSHVHWDSTLEPTAADVERAKKTADRKFHG